jgi:hypothetical protein
MAPGLTGKVRRRIVFQSGDTATIRATIRINSFAVKSCAIHEMALAAGFDLLLKQSWNTGAAPKAFR